ncbi:pentatricopeptide repeat-containing protein 1, mitochondrial-like [Nilaparvata lugens]|uniref:pentatricopeptide repeat-containing protein 1, mitochondrial-like n=1 Tax=Nilaparvata lugens TaxID=108931 RepID=UPI00193D8B49|nr:pentatricopeptide repeat-containing protein 1, mitochondrial-like [Nilaparvata lugens]
MHSMAFSSQKMLTRLFLRSSFRSDIMRLVSVTDLTRYFKNNQLQQYSSVHTKFKSSEERINKFSESKHKPKPLEDLQVRADHDPDVFGDLSSDFGTRFDFVDKLPAEEGDVEEQVINKKKRLTINQYAKIMKKFLERKKLGNAIDVLETRMLKEDKVEPDRYIYNLLISACAGFGNTKKAFQLFNKMKQRGLTPSASTYTSLFNACANCPFPNDGLKRIEHLRELCLEKGHVLNHLNYHAMIKAYGRCGNVESAFKVVDEMVDNNLRLTVETFNFLLQACASDKEAGFRHSLLVWRRMLVRGMKPQIYSFNLMLRCVRDCGLGNIDTTKDVIKTILTMSPELTNQIEMRKTDEKAHAIDAGSSNSSQSIGDDNTLNVTGLISDTSVSAQLINASKVENQLDTTPKMTDNFPNLIARYPHLGDMIDIGEIVKPEHRLLLIGGCKGFLEQMDANRTVPDIKTFTLLLETIPPTLTSEQALVNAMIEKNITLDIDFFNILIKKRSMRRDYRNAKAVLKMIRQHNLSPDIVTFGVLSLSCTTLEEAIELRESIDEVGYRVNVEILGGLLKQACVQWDCNYVLFVLKVLVEEGITPSPEFMETVKRFYNSVNGFIKNERIISKRENTSIYLEKVKDVDFLNDFKNFSNYYKKFRVKVLVDVPTNHYKQFKKHDDPEDIELMNKGRN